MTANIRIGQGFDIHAHIDDPTRTLILGGVKFPGARPLVGHSDADVVAHSVADALLGAAGLGDIGEHFPDTDPKYKGIDSLTLLGEVMDKLRALGWTVANVDCSLICEEPKIAPAKAAMQKNLSDIVGAPVTVKGRRAEKLGAIGRREGIACLASALIVKES